MSFLSRRPLRLGGPWLLSLLALSLSLSLGASRCLAKARPARRVSAAAVAPAVAAATRELSAAQAARDAGRIVEAHDRVRRLLASADAESQLSPAQREQASAILALPLPERGEVVVLGEPGALVRVDDQDVARLPLPLPLLLPIGGHQIECVSGGAPLRVQIQVRSGRRMEVRANREAGAVMLSQPPHALLVSSLAGPSLPSGSSVAMLIEQGLRGSPLVLLSGASEATQQLAECKEQAGCLADVAQRSQADYVIVLSSQVQPATTGVASADAGAGASARPAEPAAADLLLRAALFDPVVADAAASEQVRCAGCTLDALAREIPLLVSRVSKLGLGRPRARIQVRVEPADAELVLNGVPIVGRPVERSVWAGELRIQAHRAGYLPQQQTSTLGEGANEHIEIKLEAIPQPVVVSRPVPLASPPVVYERQPRPLWRIVGGSLALVAGATLGGFGIGALSVHGRCIDAVQPPANQCDRLYQTQTLGTALVSVGAASAVAGVVLLAIPGSRRPMRAALPRP